MQLKPLQRNRLIVLSAIAQEQGDSIEPISGVRLTEIVGNLPETTRYDALRALEERGYVKTTWDTSTTHPVRLHSITPAGREALDYEREVLKSVGV